MSDDCVYAHPTYQALWAAVCADWPDAAPRLILRDWLMEQGLPEAVCDESSPRKTHTPYDIWSFGGGGSGSGRGSGSGSDSGSGIGRGRGIGRGSGSGSDSGSEPYTVRQMRVGQSYLVHCGDWHTFVGRVVDQLGPCTYELEKVSKIAETNNGDCWHDLAAGDAKKRKAATYRHYATKCVIPLVIAAFEWAGKLPQED